MTAHTLAQAWIIEARERGATPATPGYDDAQNLFYSGAAAMLAMTVVAGSQDGDHPIIDFLVTIRAELKEYLEDA